MERKEKIAKVVRVLTIPPIMITALIILCTIWKKDIFVTDIEFIIPILGMGVFPALAYPFQLCSEELKLRGRQEQRKLAFAFTFIGYLTTFVWVCVCKVNPDLFLIVSTFFLSAVILSIVNQVWFRASGHSCSCMGFAILLIHFFGWMAILPCLVLMVSVFWSSIKTHRHTKDELFDGVILSAVGYFVSRLIVVIVF